MSELIPYITFPGNCEEALNFYASCLDGEVKDVSRFEGSQMKVPDNFEQKILHARLYF